jgi:arsenical pump membrane protein
MPSVMGPVNIASVAATLVMLQLFFRRNIPATYDFAKRKAPLNRLDCSHSAAGRLFRS